METLQKALEHALADVPHSLLAELVRKKLGKQGIELTARELTLLREHLRNGTLESLTLKRKSRAQTQVSVDISEEESRELVGRLEKFFNDDFPELVESLVARFSRRIFKNLKRRWDVEWRAQMGETAGFRRRLELRWKIPLSKLRMLVTISREFGSNINQALRSVRDRGRGHLVEVLTRSHARACQVVEEIICLLSAGFADGAMARWRTLHEMAVVALFIQSHGENTAEKYRVHEVVESQRAGLEYRRWQDKLGLEALSNKEFDELTKSYNTALAKYGTSFRTPYGWAATELQNPNPTFADIERAAGIDHLRPYYRMASHNVHANPKGVFFKLGLMPETPMLLSGPSNAGLADPGHSAAISLVQASTAIGLLRPTFDNLVAMQIMRDLEKEVGAAFLAAHRRLDRDERRWRRHDSQQRKADRTRR